MSIIERMVKLEQALRELSNAVENFVPLASEWPELIKALNILNNEEE